MQLDVVTWHGSAESGRGERRAVFEHGLEGARGLDKGDAPLRSVAPDYSTYEDHVAFQEIPLEEAVLLEADGKRKIY